MPHELPPVAAASDSNRNAAGHPAARHLPGLAIMSAGHALFAATMAGVGIVGLTAGRFVSIWHSVPHGVPGRAGLAYVCAVVSLVCGVGLLLKRFAAAAAGVLWACLLLWLLLVKGYYIALAPTVEGSYQSAGETAVLVAGAWVLLAWLSADPDARHLRVAAGARGVRFARTLYALALIAFGFSHFAYLDLTAPLVPAWLPAHVFWAYATGTAYLAAAAAMLTGRLARLGAALSVLQMGLFTLLVWILPMAAGHPSAGQWSELGVSWALTAAAWVVADSYRGTPWLAAGRV